MFNFVCKIKKFAYDYCNFNLISNFSRNLDLIPYSIACKQPIVGGEAALVGDETALVGDEANIFVGLFAKH